MLRAAMTTFELTGSWSGHYEQSGGRHGISMRVAQRGQSFVGAMRDANTVLASREPLPGRPSASGGSTEIVGEAEVLSTLPEHSIIEGEVTGRVVAFEKRYRGKSTTSIRLAKGKTMSFELEGHVVLYRGTLDASGNEIAGHWRIPPRDGSPGLRGAFLLRRAAVAPATER